MPPRAVMNVNCTKQPLLKQQQAIIFKSRKSKTKGQKQIKCVLVGDGAVGKTSLAVSYSNDTFPKEYIPTAFDNYSVIVQVDGQPISIQLCDTAGQNELDPLRGLCYPETDVFMLCFSVVRPSSFQSACTRWADELTGFGVPIVLVGTQADLRDHPPTMHALMQSGQSPVSQSDALQLAERLKAPYIETSALTCKHLKDAFDQAILTALRRKHHLCRRTPLWRKFCCLK